MISKNENGRSMTEMLGVLAIVGILTVVGIFGYQRAIALFRTNQTIERLTRRALQVSHQKATGEAPSLNDFKPNDGTYIIDSLESPQYDIFSMVVHRVDKDVCTNLVEHQWKVGYIDKNIRCIDIPDMTFYFSANLDEKIGEIAPSDTKCSGSMCGGTCCPSNATCVQDVCKCPNDVPEFFRGKCYVPCPEGQKRDPLGVCKCPDGQFSDGSGHCIQCSSNSPYTATQEQCHMCADTEYPRFWSETNNQCYLCNGSQTDVYPISREECAICGRYRAYYMWAAYSSSGTDCRWTCSKIATNTTLSCPSGQISSIKYSYRSNNTRSCVSCDVDDDIYTSAEECHQCPGRVMMNNSKIICGKDHDVVCKKCPSSFNTDVGAEECRRCPNIGWIIEKESGGAMCGECAKDPTRMIQLWSSEDTRRVCEQCPNHEMLNSSDCYLKCPEGQFRYYPHNCADCDSTTQNSALSSERCHSCNINGVNKRFVASHPTGRPSESGNCPHCNSPGSYTAEKSECDLCPNRKWENGECFLNNCADGYYRKSDHSCGVCKRGTAGTITSDHKKDCTERFFGDVNEQGLGTYNLCTVTKSVITTQEDCNWCGSRTWESNGTTNPQGIPLGTCNKQTN